jgi:glycosyltransferase involved in cell wall biosynthesis
MAVGGAQNLLLSQADWFHARGYPVITAFLYDRDGLCTEWQAQHTYPVINLRMRSSSDRCVANTISFITGVVSLSKLIRKGRISVVMAYTHHANLVAMPVAWFERVSVRLASHHGRMANLGRFLEWMHAVMVNLGIATKLIASSREVQDQSMREGVDSSRIMIIPNGVPPIKVDSEVVNACRRLVTPDPVLPLLVCIGRLVEEKGHIDLLHAMPSVLERLPQTRLALVGIGPLDGALKQVCIDLRIDASVDFLGMQESIHPWLAAAELFVMPSRSEGLPLALLEAMSLGCPIVATQVGGIPEALQGGACGLLVPPNDPNALAQAIIDLLLDPEKRRLLGTAAQQRFQVVYSLNEMCAAYERLFRSLAGRNKS